MTTTTTLSNWRDDLDGALLNMALFEREYWMNRQLELLADPEEAEKYTESFAHVVHWLREKVAEEEKEPDDEWKRQPVDFYGVVYGDGGVHRYYVHGDGSIRFSEGHAGWNTKMEEVAKYFIIS